MRVKKAVGYQNMNGNILFLKPGRKRLDILDRRKITDLQATNKKDGFQTINTMINISALEVKRRLLL